MARKPRPLSASSKGIAKTSRSSRATKPVPPARNTSGSHEAGPSIPFAALKTPRVPPSAEKFSSAERKTLVKKLVPNPMPEPSDDIKTSIKALEPAIKRFHGTKVPLSWFLHGLLKSPCADKFGYKFSKSVRNASKLPFDTPTQDLLNLLGNLIGDVGRDAGPESTIPAGYTYFGQFVDHDITMDVSSSIESPQDANTITNVRTPALDLDSVYRRGPALEPYLYTFPPLTSTTPTAIKMQLGRNTPSTSGGPLNAAQTPAIPVDFDVPRVLSGTNTTVVPSASTFTAILGDPRNDENLIVSQLHHAMLKFHNKVVDQLVGAGFSGDIFSEAKKIVTHHYQWCVVHDFLPKICGQVAVNHAISSVSAPVGSPFRMPVEFAVAAYRFGHSMIRNGYVLNSSLPASISTLANVFAFVRPPLLPVLSNWAIDFNMFFNTAHPVAGFFNNARKIDSNLANDLQMIPGGSGIMAVLAARNLRRGLAMGLPSGQAAAKALGITPMTATQLSSNLPPAETTILNSNGGILLKKTPLWYYVLREAMVLQNGDQLGPLGARIVAETFVRMLKRDGESFMRVPGGFTPSLPSSTPGTFTIADMLEFAGVLVQ